MVKSRAARVVKWPLLRVFSAGMMRGSSDAIGPLGIYAETKNAKGFLLRVYIPAGTLPSLSSCDPCLFKVLHGPGPSLDVTHGPCGPSVHEASPVASEGHGQRNGTHRY